MIAWGREYLGMPKHWSDFDVDTTYAHLWLAIAYHAVGDRVNFRKYAAAVDASHVTNRVRKEIADSYDKAGISQ